MAINSVHGFSYQTWIHWGATEADTVPVTVTDPLPTSLTFTTGSGDDAEATAVSIAAALPVAQHGSFAVTQETLTEAMLAELRKIRFGLEQEYGRDFPDPTI